MELNFAHAYFITVFLETIILYLVLRNRYAMPLIVRNAIIANTITLPFVWFVFPLLRTGYWNVLAISEISAFAAEAAIYKILFPKISLNFAVPVSFICNLASLSVGLLIWTL